MMAPDQRLAWLDIAKGLGMVLVVVGHVLLGSDSVYTQSVANAIYAFHMPLFFVLAGFTLKPQTPRDFALRKIVRFGIPYLAFLIMLGVPALMLSCGLGVPQPALGVDRCPVLALKLLTGGSLLAGIFGTLWFVPCLFGGLVIAQLVLSARSGLPRMLAFTLLVGAAYLLPAALPWSTDILSLGSAPMAAVLVLVGYVLAQANWLDSKFLYAGCALAGFGVLAVGARVDFKFAEYGMLLLSMAGAVALSCLIVGLSKQMASVPVFARSLGYVGQSTLTVLYLHQLMHLALRLAGMDNDIVLIMLSLAVPLVLHGITDRARYHLTHRLPLDLSRKSPRLARSLE